MTKSYPKALLTVGVLALVLVFGVTSGSMAAKLITGKDIKENTIKWLFRIQGVEGAVTARA